MTHAPRPRAPRYTCLRRLPRKLALKKLEPRKTPTVTPVGQLTNYLATPLPVNGGDDAMGIAVHRGAGVYATAYAFEEDVEIRQSTVAFNIVPRAPAFPEVSPSKLIQ